MLTFDPKAHVYYWHGKPVPNVTRIIGHLTDYSHIPEKRLVELQEEGRQVHSMVEMACAGTLEFVPDWLVPHYTAWERFVAETGFEPILSEYQLYHPTMGYAGTLDLLGEFKKLKGAAGVALIDVKRSLFAGPAIGLQLAGYAQSVYQDRALPRPRRRYALRLTSEGKYHLDDGVKVNGHRLAFDDPENDSAFLACLQQFRWRRKYYKETDDGSA